MNKRFDVLEKRYEDLEKNYELIKEENKKYKSAIQNNEQIIMILKKQIILVRKENEINLKKLEELFNKQFQNLKQLIENNQNMKRENNEIIIKENNNEFLGFENLDRNSFNLLEDNNLNKNNLKKAEEKESHQSQKNEKKDEIIEFKGRTLFELLESKLFKIFSEQSLDINKNDINELKKICSAILIRDKKAPTEKINEFLTKNFNNYQKELDENNKKIITHKKAKIFENIKDISLKKIKAKDNEQYIKQFREKFGITEKDYCDINLKKLIKKDKKEMDILKHIFVELKYIKNK